MIYAISILAIIQFLFIVYCIKHIKFINKELDAISRERGHLSMDIVHLMKSNVEIIKVIDNHSKNLNQLVTATEYLFGTLDKSKMPKDKPIFKSPEGEA